MLRAGIRLAQLGDIERLRWVEIDAGQRFQAVGLHAIAEDDPPAGEALAAKVAQGRLWVAERVGGEPTEHGPVGVLGYAAASTVDGHAHLDQVSVIGEAAGRGIGAQLLAARDHPPGEMNRVSSWRLWCRCNSSAPGSAASRSALSWSVGPWNLTVKTNVGAGCTARHRSINGNNRVG